ncbi:MAG TPA: hypothetical protein VF183_10835 [Acidimicrobiales bacterium]
MAVIPRWRVVKRYARTTAIRRGLLGGDRFWLGVLVLGLLGRQVNKVLKRGDMPVVFSERLEPGQVLTISHLPAPERKRRKR